MPAKISILIPVYNVENYLKECMDSVVNQTFKDIEIICVNDCSTDNSLAILQQYSENDSRIVIVDKKQNEGLLMARKSGVEAATGEYILFVDSDDYIDLNLCQFVKDVTEKEDADIIQFSSDVISESDGKKLSEHIKELQPLEKALTGIEILDNAFIKRTYATQMWGKIYKTELCKKVYAVLPDEHCYVGEDVFTCFFLSYFADKYIGIKTPFYYVYRYGLGVSGVSKISLNRFEMFCKMANWIKYTQKFLNDNGAGDMHQKACEAMKERLFADCCEIYRNRIKEEDKNTAQEYIYNYWKDINVNEESWIKYIGRTREYLKNQSEICNSVKENLAYKEFSPKISVIVPVYNDAHNIEEFAEKMFVQTLKDIEFIFINDGSDDISIEIIEKLYKKDNRITIINQKHNGISNANNVGLKYSKGEYIYFSNITQILYTDALERLYITAKSKNIDILCFNSFDKREVVSGDVVMAEFVQKNMSIGDLSTKLFRKDLIKYTGKSFDERISKSNEIFIPLELLSAKRVLSISDEYIKCNRKCETEDRYDLTYEDFAEYFIIYTTLAAENIVSKYDYEGKCILSELARKFYSIANDIYMQLSPEQTQKVNESLPIEYKPLFFNTRELKNVKQSVTYRLADKFASIPRKFKGN